MDEMCTRKHLMPIGAYAQETVAMEDDPEYSHLLRELADEARAYRNEEERLLCGDEVCLALADWSRDWRKEFEAYSLTCEMRDQGGERASEAAEANTEDE